MLQLILDLPVDNIFLSRYHVFESWRCVSVSVCVCVCVCVCVKKNGGRGVGYFSELGNLGGVNYLKWVGKFYKRWRLHPTFTSATVI